jgi:hypothetical protein
LKELDAFVDAVDRLEKYRIGAIELNDPGWDGWPSHTYRLMGAKRRLAELLERLPNLPMP